MDTTNTNLNDAPILTPDLTTNTPADLTTTPPAATSPSGNPTGKGGNDSGNPGKKSAPTSPRGPFPRREGGRGLGPSGKHSGNPSGKKSARFRQDHTIAQAPRAGDTIRCMHSTRPISRIRLTACAALHHNGETNS